jgi:hypothetical protein
MSIKTLQVLDNKSSSYRGFGNTINISVTDSLKGGVLVIGVHWGRPRRRLFRDKRNVFVGLALMSKSRVRRGDGHFGKWSFKCRG